MQLSDALRRATLAAVATLVLPACAVEGSGSPPRAKQSVQLAPVAATPSVRVVAAGDIACKPRAKVGPRKCRHRATAALAVRLRPQLVLPLGDTQYQRGELRNYRRSYARTWGRLLSRTRPTVGNHEYRTKGARGYYAYFKNRQPGPPGYYRSSVAGWAVYHLNSNCTKVNCRTQAVWLDRQMAARPARCTIVTMHHPRFSSGNQGNAAFTEPFWDVAHKHGNDLVLSGHNHMYERFHPLDGNGRVNAARGMQSFVVGTGGRSLFPLGSRKHGSAYLQNRIHGVLALDLRPGAYSWAFHAIDGRVLDRGSRACS
jgi:hypothetical protein